MQDRPTTWGKPVEVSKKQHQNGFSIVELLTVLTFMTILAAAALYYSTAHQTMYKTDEEALKIVDVLQEARQRSLSQRETHRVEVDLTDKVVRLIDENTVATETDDRLVRSVPLADGFVRVDSRSPAISSNPPEPFPVPTAQYKVSIYPPSVTHNVLTLRYQSNGTVVDAGTTATGSGAISSGITLHVWTPMPGDPNTPKIARAITIVGSTGTVRLWEYNPELTGSEKWQNSRR